MSFILTTCHARRSTLVWAELQQLMRYWPIWMLLVATAATAGCGKSAPALSANTATNAQPPEAADSPPQPPTRGTDLQMPAQAPAVIPNDGNTSATLGALSLELRRYVLRTRTAPKTFEEFQANSKVQAPPPPAGKKYAIQQGAVVLVNR